MQTRPRHGLELERGRRNLRLLSVIATVFTIICSPVDRCFSQSNENEITNTNRLVIVRLRFNALFDGSKTNQLLLTDLAKYVPPLVTTAKRGDTAATLFAQTYGIGDPVNVSIGQKAALNLNHLSKFTSDSQQFFLTPAFPRSSNPASNTNSIAAPYLKLSGLREDFSLAVPRNEDPSIAPLTTNNTIHTYVYADPHYLPASNLPEGESFIEAALTEDKFRDLSNSPYLGRNIEELLASPVQIKLAAVSSTSDVSSPHPVLSPEEVDTISNALAQSHGKTILFLQDTGWPTPEDMTNAYESLYSMMDAIWTNGFGRSRSPYARRIPKFAAPQNHHCIEVKLALKEFETLDTNHSVQSVFVPLTREQGSEALLTEMVELSLLLDEVRYAKGLSVVAREIPTEESQAKQIVRALPNVWSSDYVVTDDAVLCSILQIVNWYATTLSKQHYFVSQSWTTPHLQYKIGVPEYFPGAIAAAAGNEGTNFNVLENRPDFVERCVGYADTLGVLNVHPHHGLDSSSSDIFAPSDPTAIDAAFVVGFDGQVDAAENGTSFSAPRVAWLLTAAEATIKEPFKTSPLLWGGKLKKIVKASRNSSNDSDKFLLDPVKLFANYKQLAQ